MPKSSTATRTELTDRALNPIRSVAALPNQAYSPGQVIFVSLVYQGVSFVPEDLYDALATKYGAGKVQSDNDTQSMGQLAFRITP